MNNQKEKIMEKVTAQFVEINKKNNPLTDSQLNDIYNGFCQYEKNEAVRTGKPLPELKDFEKWKFGFQSYMNKVRGLVNGTIQVRKNLDEILKSK
jgi:hypothetical protein